MNEEDARMILSNVDPQVLLAMKVLGQEIPQNTVGTSASHSKPTVVEGVGEKQSLDLKKDVIAFPEYLISRFVEERDMNHGSRISNDKRRQDPEAFKDIYRFVYNEIFRKQRTHYYNNIYLLKEIIKLSMNGRSLMKYNIVLTDLEVDSIYQKVLHLKAEKIRNDPIVRQMAQEECRKKGIDYLIKDTKSFRKLGRDENRAERKHINYHFTPMTISARDVEQNRKDLEAMQDVPFQYDDGDSEFEAVCVLMKLCFANRYTDMNQVNSKYSYRDLIEDYPILKSFDWLAFDWNLKW